MPDVDLNDIPMLAQQKVLPFVETRTCISCGLKESRAWWTRLLSRFYVRFGVGWCRGNRPPTEPTHGGEMAVLCAGISEPHLHVQCPRCSYYWLMETKSA